DSISHEEILKSPSPTLSQISHCIDENQSLIVISMAINEVNSLFRQDRRMDKLDVIATARAILRRYWYLKPEDIKKCFTGPRPKSFVLEGDSFLSWLAEYDLKRDNACESAGIEPKEAAPSENAVSFEEWCRSRPKEGNYLAYGRSGKPPKTKEEKERENAAFQQFRKDYLKSKGITPK
ncbi:MAG: hypothetical protein K2L00_10370, partial [Muribaculaceae bacterium]|nr:hypothetical protein [Muribaculaceae bacterium]